MGLRPARCYRKVTQHPYTRTAKKVMRKAFITGVPGSRIHTFDMGDQRGKYEVEASLVIQEPMQLRHNQLEAARVASNQYMTVKVKEPFFMKIRPYPHHVLREHALAAGAGADRFSTGMARAFGKPTGTAARVKKGQKVISIFTNKANIDIAKESLRRARMKLSGKYRVIIEEIKK